MTRYLAAALVASTALVSVAHAAPTTTATQSQTILRQATDWNSTLSFAQFNSALGTLLSVNILLEASIGTNEVATLNNAIGDTSRLQFINTGGNTTVMTGKISNTVTLAVVPSLSVTVSVPPVGSFSNNVGVGQTITEDNLAGVNSTTTQLTDNVNTVADELAAFKGLGTISLGAIGDGSFDCDSGNGNGVCGFRIFGGARVEISYTYEPVTTEVPVPATLALFGAALVGLGVARRRA